MTDPAPIKAFLPIVIPQTIVQFAQNWHLFLSRLFDTHGTGY